MRVALLALAAAPLLLLLAEEILIQL